MTEAALFDMVYNALDVRPLAIAKALGDTPPPEMKAVCQALLVLLGASPADVKTWPQVRTRLGECDVGWAPLYHTSARERCNVADPDACANLTDASEVANGDWEPYRCCNDYAAPYLPWSIAVMYSPSGSQNDGSVSFFTNVFKLLAEGFFLNFLWFLFLFC